MTDSQDTTLRGPRMPFSHFWWQVRHFPVREWLAERIIRFGTSIIPENNLIVHARRELVLAGWFEPDGLYGDMMGHSALREIKLFSLEGHSGMSAGLSISIMQKLQRFEPLTPLTGEDSEWVEVSEGLFQNRRCGRVFKEPDGQAYDSNGKVFEEPDGGRYISRESRVSVEFPYTPKTEVVKVGKLT